MLLVSNWERRERSAYHCLSLRTLRKACARPENPMHRLRGLYAITDGPRPDLHLAVAAALAGGAAVVQYRDKTRDEARRLEEVRLLAALCARYAVPLIVNDDPQLALTGRAAGVHLGSDDADPAEARNLLGPGAIIGVSCYDSLTRAETAVASGASYVAFGAFFASRTKPEARCAPLALLRQSSSLGVPRVAIGGITPDNASALIAAGADCVAVISSLFESTDIESAARRFSSLFS